MRKQQIGWKRETDSARQQGKEREREKNKSGFKMREREKRTDQVSRSQIGRSYVDSLASRVCYRRRRPPARNTGH